MKKKGFALIEVMFGMVFASAAILGFFSFVSHLLSITQRSINSITIIEDVPIIYSKIFFDKKNSKIEGEIKNEENNFLNNFSTIESNYSNNKNIKSIESFINLKNKNKKEYFINNIFYEKKEKAK